MIKNNFFPYIKFLKIIFYHFYKNICKNFSCLCIFFISTFLGQQLTPSTEQTHVASFVRNRTKNEHMWWKRSPLLYLEICQHWLFFSLRYDTTKKIHFATTQFYLWIATKWTVYWRTFRPKPRTKEALPLESLDLAGMWADMMLRGRNGGICGSKEDVSGDIQTHS